MAYQACAKILQNSKLLWRRLQNLKPSVKRDPVIINGTKQNVFVVGAYVVGNIEVWLATYKCNP